MPLEHLSAIQRRKLPHLREYFLDVPQFIQTQFANPVGRFKSQATSLLLLLKLNNPKLSILTIGRIPMYANPPRRWRK
jgi:hypothetical protein